MLSEQTKSSNEDKELSGDSLKETQKEFQAKWEWLSCNYEFKRESNGIETHWSLAPTIQLVASDPKIPPKVDIAISLERSFMHSDELGWNWHKSWNLPNITIQIKITDQKTNEVILPPSDLKAQLLAVKVLSNKAELFKLYDLGLKGAYTQDLSEGQTVFSGIKFSSTSYNNEGVKFHLIVLIYIQEEGNTRTCPKILYSRISPPIFVDSRKSARDSNIIRNKKIVYKYFDPFLPESFEKIFIKRNNKQIDSKEEIIENSLEGLSQYFTAPNIRNKVKHPIFLAVKFSRCVKLYYNVNLIRSENEKKELNEEELIQIMQKVFMESHYKSKAKNDSNPNMKCFYNKYFILLIEEPNNADAFQHNKKAILIADYLDPIQNEVLHVIFNSNITPSNFQEIDHVKLSKAYIKIYSIILAMKNSYPNKLLNNSEEYGEKYKKFNSRRDSENNNDEDDEKSEKDESDIEDEDGSNNQADSESEEPPIRKQIKTNGYSNNENYTGCDSASRTRSIQNEEEEKENIQVKEEINDGQLTKINSNGISSHLISNNVASNVSMPDNLTKMNDIESLSSMNNQALNQTVNEQPAGNIIPKNADSIQSNIINHMNTSGNQMPKLPSINPNTIGSVSNSIFSQVKSPNFSSNCSLPHNNSPQNIPMNQVPSNPIPLSLNANNLANQISNSNSNQPILQENKGYESDISLLLAFQQEQMKNNILVNFFNQNSIENQNKFDLIKLAALNIPNNNMGGIGLNPICNGSFGNLSLVPVNGFNSTNLAGSTGLIPNQTGTNITDRSTALLPNSFELKHDISKNELTSFLLSMAKQNQTMQNSPIFMPQLSQLNSVPKNLSQISTFPINREILPNINSLPFMGQLHHNSLHSNFQNQQNQQFNSNQLRMMMGINSSIADSPMTGLIGSLSTSQRSNHQQK